jgi:hypothetical protein
MRRRVHARCRQRPDVAAYPSRLSGSGSGDRIRPFQRAPGQSRPPRFGSRIRRSGRWRVPSRPSASAEIAWKRVPGDHGHGRLRRDTMSRTWESADGVLGSSQVSSFDSCPTLSSDNVPSSSAGINSEIRTLQFAPASFVRQRPAGTPTFTSDALQRLRLILWNGLETAAIPWREADGAVSTAPLGSRRNPSHVSPEHLPPGWRLIERTYDYRTDH